MKRSCLEPGCRALFEGSGSRCPAHARLADRARQARRGARYKGDWPRISREQRRRVPYCELCGATEDLTADHYRGGVRTLCRLCNRRDGERPDEREAVMA